jgi:hypothetical protein
MPILAIDFKTLFSDIPRGAWVAISNDETHVIAYGADMRTVLEDARAKGESNPIITRVPESESAVML